MKITPREKGETRCRLFSCGVFFTRARVSLALLSSRTNGGLLVVYCRHKYMKYSCYQDSSVIRRRFVYLVFGLRKASPRDSTKVKVEHAGFLSSVQETCMGLAWDSRSRLHITFWSLFFRYCNYLLTETQANKVDKTKLSRIQGATEY